MGKLRLIPYPKKCEISDGTLCCKTIRLSGEECFAAKDFIDGLAEGGFTVSDVADVTVNYSFNSQDIIGAEAYELIIGADGVSLRASAQGGLLYGFCTLRQLLFNYDGVLPYCKIFDEPYLKYRGLLLDNGRYFFDKKYVLKLIDFCLLNKLNVLHWHLTEDQGWRVEIDKYPLLTSKGSKRSHTNFGCKPHGGYYTKEDIREIVAYANARNVEVIPEIDMPGHAQAAIACYPYLSCFDRKLKVATHWGVKHDPLCVGKESTFEFVFDVLEEIIDLFGGDNTKRIHIGGDEVFRHRWSLCPHCQARIKEQGLKDEQDLQVYFMRRLSQWLVERGYTPVMWNGVESDVHVHEKAVWHFWSDERGGKVDEVLKKALESGGYINSSSTFTYLDFTYGRTNLKMAYSFNPVPDGYPDDKFVGSEMCLWTEYVPDFKTACVRLMPRALALAESFWTGGEKDYADFERRATFAAKYIEAQGFKSVPIKKANPGKLRGALQEAWFGRRVLHWQGLHNLIDDARVTAKYSKKRK